MPRPHNAFIHPTAVIAPEAQLAEGVRVGPFVVIDGQVTIGPGTVIHPHAHLIGSLTLGANNHIGSGVVLGGAPQHLAYKGEPSTIVIGDGNIFREHSTVHRGMPRFGIDFLEGPSEDFPCSRGGKPRAKKAAKTAARAANPPKVGPKGPKRKG